MVCDTIKSACLLVLFSQTTDFLTSFIVPSHSLTKEGSQKWWLENGEARFRDLNGELYQNGGCLTYKWWHENFHAVKIALTTYWVPEK